MGHRDLQDHAIQMAWKNNYILFFSDLINVKRPGMFLFKNAFPLCLWNKTGSLCWQTQHSLILTSEAFGQWHSKLTPNDKQCNAGRHVLYTVNTYR